MLSIARQLDITDAARSAIRAEWVLAESLGTPLREVHQRVESVIAQAAQHKGYPRREIYALRAYDAAIFDMFRIDRYVFLYCVEGKMYSARKDVCGLPNWRTLPRSEYDTLADKGGLYWRKLAEQGIYKIAASNGSVTANDKAGQIKA